MWTKFWSILALTSLLYAGIGPIAAVPVEVQQTSDEATETVNVANVPIDTVLESGTRRDDQSCEFSNSQVLSVKKAHQERWHDFAVTEDCDLILAHRWVGTLSDAPFAVKQANGWIEEKEEAIGALNGDVTDRTTWSTVMGAASCQEHRQRIYTYGGGGPTFDKLTQIDSMAGICSDGSDAWIEFDNRDCSGADLGLWYWEVDGCSTTAINSGPANLVWKTDLGQFHCQPDGNPNPCGIGNNYYHSIFSRIRGWDNGDIVCDWWHTGDVVFGPNQQLLLGC